MDDKSGEKLLTEMKEKIEKIKSSIATKTGTLNALMGRLKKEFHIKKVEEIYTRLDEIVTWQESLDSQFHTLSTKASEKLAAYEI